MDKLGSHSRAIALAANVNVQVFAVESNRDSPVTWMITATNRIDGVTPTILLTADHTGPSGVNLPIQTELAPRESVQMFLTGSVTVNAIAIGNTILEISITAVGGTQIAIPPERFTVATGAAAWAGLSQNFGCAPPGRRWFTVYADAAFDLRILDPAGNVLWTVAAISTTLPRFSGTLILPPAFHLQGKGNAAAVNITTVWTQYFNH